jgi:hypothetical protein
MREGRLSLRAPDEHRTDFPHDRSLERGKP